MSRQVVPDLPIFPRPMSLKDAEIEEIGFFKVQIGEFVDCDETCDVKMFPGDVEPDLWKKWT